jgi:1,2-dihydroxy-3-keto-5-methylthiopentene dioxygenase
MARLEFKGKKYTDPSEIKSIMSEYGIPFESWGVRGTSGATDDKIIGIYKPEIDKLMRERSYQTVDLVALKKETPNLDVITAKFDKEHHHIDDEVRFTVEGEGVFEINYTDDERMKFTAEPGDLIVIPAMRRHLFYLTDKKNIRCIRLFKTKEGWEAIYEKVS